MQKIQFTSFNFLQPSRLIWKEGQQKAREVSSVDPDLYNGLPEKAVHDLEVEVGRQKRQAEEAFDALGKEVDEHSQNEGDEEANSDSQSVNIVKDHPQSPFQFGDSTVNAFARQITQERVRKEKKDARKKLRKDRRTWNKAEREGGEAFEKVKKEMGTDPNEKIQEERADYWKNWKEVSEKEFKDISDDENWLKPSDFKNQPEEDLLEDQDENESFDTVPDKDQEADKASEEAVATPAESEKIKHHEEGHKATQDQDPLPETGPRDMPKLLGQAPENASPEVQRAFVAAKAWEALTTAENPKTLQYLAYTLQQTVANFHGEATSPDIISEFITRYEQGPEHDVKLIAGLKELNLLDVATGLVLMLDSKTSTLSPEGMQSIVNNIGQTKLEGEIKLLLNQVGQSWEKLHNEEIKAVEQESANFNTLKEAAEASWQKEIQPRFNELFESPEKSAEVLRMVFDFMGDENPYNTKARDLRVQYGYFLEYAPRLYAGNVKQNGEYFVEIICKTFGKAPDTIAKNKGKILRQGYQLLLQQDVAGIASNEVDRDDLDGALGAETAVLEVCHGKRYLGPISFGREIEFKGNKNDPSSLKGINYTKIKNAQKLGNAYAEKWSPQQVEALNRVWLQAQAIGDNYAMAICKSRMSDFGYLPSAQGPQSDPDFERRMEEEAQKRRSER